MNSSKIIKPKYEITMYDGRNISTKTAPRQEAQAIHSNSVDHFLSLAFGIWAYRTHDGDWIEYSVKWPKLGSVCIKLIQAVQLNPGEFLTPGEISELTGYAGADINNWLAARWLAIRKAHQESYKNPHFFLSRRAGGMAVAWNPEKTWMWIDRVPLPTLENHSESDRLKQT